MGREVLHHEHALLELPARCGGLALANPVSSATANYMYAPSKCATAVLQEAVCSFRPSCWYDVAFTALQVNLEWDCMPANKKLNSFLQRCLRFSTNSATVQTLPHREEWGVDLAYCPPSVARWLWPISNAVSRPAGDPLWVWAYWASICGCGASFSLQDSLDLQEGWACQARPW